MVFQRLTPFPLLPSSVGGFRPPHILTNTFLCTVLHRSHSGGEVLQFEDVFTTERSTLTSLHQMAKLVVLICISLRTDIVEHLFMGWLGWPFDRQLWINVSPEHLPILIDVSENGVFLI